MTLANFGGSRTRRKYARSAHGGNTLVLRLISVRQILDFQNCEKFKHIVPTCIDFDAGSVVENPFLKHPTNKPNTNQSVAFESCCRVDFDGDVVQKVSALIQQGSA